MTVFQPHRYSRTEALWRDFADAFEGADLLVLTDIYPAGEAPRPGVTGKLVVDAVLDAHGRQAVAYMPSLDDVVDYLGRRLRPGDLCLTLGAGDLTTLPDEVLDPPPGPGTLVGDRPGAGRSKRSRRRSGDPSSATRRSELAPPTGWAGPQRCS